MENLLLIDLMYGNLSKTIKTELLNTLLRRSLKKEIKLERERLTMFILD